MKAAIEDEFGVDVHFTLGGCVAAPKGTLVFSAPTLDILRAKLRSAR